MTCSELLVYLPLQKNIYTSLNEPLHITAIEKINNVHFSVILTNSINIGIKENILKGISALFHQFLFFWC